MAADSNGLAGDQKVLYSVLPDDGSAVGNISLQRTLRWSSSRYFTARDALVDSGLLVRGRGRGGTVRRASLVQAQAHTVSIVVDEDTDPAATVEAVIKNELALYPPMKKVIEGDWAKDHRSDPLAVEVTALQGRRATGGMWSRPDIVSIEVRTYPYVPGKHLEVVTFEVKASNAINVQGVYEALAHRRAATRSYVLFHVPNGDPELEVAVDEVAEVASAHGVGIVTAGDPSDYQTWEERVEARRVEPDPERLNTFIATQLSEKTRDLISRRLR